MTKQELREHIKERIRQMSKEDIEIASINVCRKISASAEWKRAKSVLLYAALPDELDLGPLVRDAELSGKRIYLPVVDGDELQLRLYDPQRVVRKGKYNILEPSDDCPVPGSCEEIDLAIIPGRAFSRDGMRLGRGRGYYDRCLGSLRCPRWGVALACQVVDDIPADPWDVRLDRVVEPSAFER